MSEQMEVTFRWNEKGDIHIEEDGKTLLAIVFYTDQYNLREKLELLQEIIQVALNTPDLTGEVGDGLVQQMLPFDGSERVN